MSLNNLKGFGASLFEREMTTSDNTGFAAQFVLGNVLCLSKVLILESSADGKMSKSGLVNILLKKVKFEGILEVKLNMGLMKKGMGLYVIQK